MKKTIPTSRKDAAGITQPNPIETIKISDLQPFPRNPRFHSESNIAKIAMSIKAYGWTTPVLITDTKEVIAGHGRLLAATELGMINVPCIRLSHLTPDLVDAYRVADNRLAMDSEWDEQLLTDTLKHLQSLDFDLTLMGFDLIEIDSRLGTGSDANKEWEGMPEFYQEDKTAFRSVMIHFADQNAVDDFSKLVQQDITERTKYLHFPKWEEEKYIDKGYRTEDEEESDES
jgi:ParB-like chromosome segregation protein Spo0J